MTTKREATLSRGAPQSSLLVLTTLPQREAAEALARELLAARLAACIQIGTTVHSLYHWHGEIETADETPVAIKTRQRCTRGSKRRSGRCIRTNFRKLSLSRSAMVCPHTSNGSPPKPWRLGSALRYASAFGVAVALALPALGQVSPLPPDKALRFSARALNPETIETRFTIAEGYYLYRDRIRFTVEPATAGLNVRNCRPARSRRTNSFGGSRPIAVASSSIWRSRTRSGAESCAGGRVAGLR